MRNSRRSGSDICRAEYNGMVFDAREAGTQPAVVSLWPRLESPLPSHGHRGLYRLEKRHTREKSKTRDQCIRPPTHPQRHLVAYFLRHAKYSSRPHRHLAHVACYHLDHRRLLESFKECGMALDSVYHVGELCSVFELEYLET